MAGYGGGPAQPKQIKLTGLELD
ncbi:hypothetical protein CCACVL1_24066 [Corchorus capsularis]|uniref:Uncharacterized protein n=1 Tax=Corchorus capsularis TaxID=210143 RepID=A0A1R3GR60_COCAP|nr:hypothetical protein CCACVL1_24066 [Corchorus capsularis]